MPKKILRGILGLILVVLLVLAGSYFSSKYMLSVSKHSIPAEDFSKSVRIVQLTDLHNSVFGKDNSRLISLVKKQDPDLILITGDLVNGEDPNDAIAVDLIKKLCDVAPVYVSGGNHEAAYERNFGVDLGSVYRKAGAVFLEKEYEDITVNGQDIRIGGIYGYCLPAKYLKTKEADPEECAYLEEFQDTGRYTVLMCHMPVCWIKNGGLNEWDIDCVVTGHVHGGQVIIPFVGGAYGPDFGRFPGRLEGLFYSDDKSKTLVLSRGLGTVENIPRLNNIPEVMVIDLVPEEG